MIEDFIVPNMGHGIPLDLKVTNGGGTAGPFMLDVGISSTRHIAASWGIANSRSKAQASAVPPTVDRADEQDLPTAMMPTLRSVRPERISGSQPKRDMPSNGVQQIIEKALKAAGLMR